MIGLANPWVILAVVIGLGVSHSAAFLSGKRVGANAEKVYCEIRVSNLVKKIDDQNKAIDKINEAWAAAVEKVWDVYNADQLKAEQETATLEKKVTDYEATLKANPACVLDQHDIDSVD